MIIYPAIDLRDGRCVRLVEGDFSRETVFDADPAAAARRWADAGAEWLHVVDLDGAVAGQPVNLPAIAAIRAAVDIPIQLGGGLRSLTNLEDAFAAGISRTILGTVALQDPDLVASAVQRWGEAIAVGLDARDGKLATRGWLDQSDALAGDVAYVLANAGVRHFIFTDIRRDGTLSGPNLETLSDLIASIDASFIASGGVGALADVEAAREVGAAGAIVGRALYDGRVNLAEAIALARPPRTEA
ncbi:MAG: 1-(5-phosphoribosyl)-5-[(5-phosphoribosylamino)methylideneamino]imidazole-4-carboxamide isomerase [Thermomicrobiales bacterium]|nr:1-(5-phosphoribosyl)-5-[(5-phosphoribosylamino)methylideneamino]imidazole-4-carboxamide isomerase [Thermomicrobiales bacterium]MCA9880987.1 1-(5-phosphoribosyl)-5-[(5-phosphoribosylamino)methylideneamino]imidazole-4-carboxamide isomerase [Thermomicrobiales bacterium]